MSVRTDVAMVERRIAVLGGISTGPHGAASNASGFRRAMVDVESLVKRAAAAAHVDPALASAVARTESNFDPAARSASGAEGVMQLMPSTAQALGVGNPYDAAQNVAAGTRYLRALLDRFDGDVRLAVAAYDAGPGAVERFGGVPPFGETRRYVERVLAAYRRRP